MDFKAEIEARDSQLQRIEERQKAIKERAMAIKAEVAKMADKAEVDKRSEELDSLSKESADLKSKRETIEKEKEDLVKSRNEEVKKALEEHNLTKERKEKMENEEIEKRAAQFMSDVRTVKGAPVAKRSILVSSVSKPITAEGVTGLHVYQPYLLGLLDVRYTDRKGEASFTYDKTDGKAAEKTPGAKASELGASVGVVKYAVKHISAYSDVDEDIDAESPVDARNYVIQKAQQAILDKLYANVIADIQTATDEDKANMYLTASVSAITASTIRDLIFAKQAGNLIHGPRVLVLNTANLQKLSAIRGTNEKKAVFDFEIPADDTSHGRIIDGGLSCEYVVDDTLPDTKMLFLKPKGIRLEIVSDLNVKVSEDYKFQEGLIGVKGDIYALYGAIDNRAVTIATVGAAA